MLPVMESGSTVDRRSEAAVESGTVRLTPEHIAAAREWMCDCEWADVDETDIRAMSDRRVEAAIARHYEGGIDQFIRDSVPTIVK
jgi:hypothetical protein